MLGFTGAMLSELRENPQLANCFFLLADCYASSGDPMKMSQAAQETMSNVGVAQAAGPGDRCEAIHARSTANWPPARARDESAI